MIKNNTVAITALSLREERRYARIARLETRSMLSSRVVKCVSIRVIQLTNEILLQWYHTSFGSQFPN